MEIRTYDYGGIVAAAESGDIDCIMGNLNATEERRQHILFSDCVYPSVTAVMVRTGTVGEAENEQKEYETLSDFGGEKFGTLNGSVADKLVQGVIDDAEDFYYYYSISDIATAIKAGRIDAGALVEPLRVWRRPEMAVLEFLKNRLFRISTVMLFRKGARFARNLAKSSGSYMRTE